MFIITNFGGAEEFRDFRPMTGETKNCWLVAVAQVVMKI